MDHHQGMKPLLFFTNLEARQYMKGARFGQFLKLFEMTL